jgi:hypothetical protein
MATQIIIYDLNSEGAAYSATNKALTDAIKRLFPTWWHHLDSTWIVVTEMTSSQIRDALKPFLDEDDELLVTKSSGEGAWHGFNDEGHKWLKAHL